MGDVHYEKQAERLNDCPILNVDISSDVKRHSLIGANRDPWCNMHLLANADIPNHIR